MVPGVGLLLITFSKPFSNVLSLSSSVIDGINLVAFIVAGIFIAAGIIHGAKVRARQRNATTLRDLLKLLEERHVRDPDV